LSAAGAQKRSAVGRWSSVRTWTAKWLAASKTARLCARVARLHSTSGGRSDTDVKELIVNPAVRPSAQRAVTTATPVGKAPSARGIRAHP